MIHLVPRYQLFTDVRVLSVATALVLAVIGLIATGDPAAAGWSTSAGGR